MLACAATAQAVNNAELIAAFTLHNQAGPPTLPALEFKGGDIQIDIGLFTGDNTASLPFHFESPQNRRASTSTTATS